MFKRKQKVIRIDAVWDEEGSVWVATSDDVPGLVVEAATIEALKDEVCSAVPDLLELNGLNHNTAKSPIELVSHQMLQACM